MQQTAAQIRAQIRTIATETLKVFDAKSLSHGQKMGRVERAEAEIAKLTTELASVEFVNGQRLNYLKATEPESFTTGHRSLDPGATMTPMYGQLATGSSHLPNLALDDDALKELFTATKSRSRLKVETKATNPDIGGMMPAILQPGISPFRTEPTRISTVLPTSTMNGPSVEYLRHTGTTGAAAVVLPGGIKPEVVTQIDTIVLTARKIAAVTTAFDENFQDFTGLGAYLSAALMQSYITAENTELLTGDGTDGLLNTPGVLTRVTGTDTALDALEQSADDLRVGPAFTSPTVFVLHPSTFSAIRRTKDLQGRYILEQSSDMTSVGPQSLWGVPVVLTTTIAPGTGIAMDAGLAGMVWVRQGVVIDTSNNGGDNFVQNLTTFRIEARLALAVVRPAAICVISGLAGA